MLRDTKIKSVQEFLETLSSEEVIWTQGYLAGLTSASLSVRPVGPVAQKLTIVYGTESGNSKKLATEFTTLAKRSGVQARLASLDQYRLSDLPTEEYLLVVISTQGDGEPPSSARKFFDHLQGNTLSLNKLNFGVLALGDTAYPLFCRAGEDVDNRLHELGATRVVSIQKCDTDYEEESRSWFDNALTSILSSSPHQAAGAPPARKSDNGKKRYTGTIITSLNLCGRGSAKQTFHLEMNAADVPYQPGDSIGVVPENPPALVDQILRLVGCQENTAASPNGIRDLLLRKLNIVYLPERVVQKYASLVRQEIPPTRIDLLNLLKIYPVRDIAQFEEVIAVLEPITPRLYSISSSPVAHPGEVHVTVARGAFSVNDEIQYGLCSDYLCGLRENSTIDFYIHHNSQFKLPPDGGDIIMIGPGTGIAPFRSFLAERDATGVQGRSWLFFGDQRFQSDFLYQTEIQSYLERGVLSRVSLAFSRDHAEKIYVQHRMMEQGEELFGWLEDGATLYLCGAKSPMGEDVEKTLLDVISLCGNRSSGQAAEYLAMMKNDGRYQKDVY